MSLPYPTLADVKVNASEYPTDQVLNRGTSRLLANDLDLYEDLMTVSGDVDTLEDSVGDIISLPSGTQGDIVYYNGTNWVALNAGTSGYVLETRGAEENPDWVENQDSVAAYGVVNGDGTKLSGSDNWTVSRNSTGQYQLNITDAGDYVVIAGFSEFHGGGADAIYPIHSQTTGIFSNNTASNVGMRYYHDVSYRDNGWNFTAIKL